MARLRRKKKRIGIVRMLMSKETVRIREMNAVLNLDGKTAIGAVTIDQGMRVEPEETGVMVAEMIEAEEGEETTVATVDAAVVVGETIAGLVDVVAMTAVVVVVEETIVDMVDVVAMPDATVAVEETIVDMVDVAAVVMPGVGVVEEMIAGSAGVAVMTDVAVEVVTPGVVVEETIAGLVNVVVMTDVVEMVGETTEDSVDVVVMTGVVVVNEMIDEMAAVATDVVPEVTTGTLRIENETSKT